MDGIYSPVRGEANERLCTLVVIGADEDGRKHLLAVEDGVRESKQSWREVLLHLQERGMDAPKLAIGDGALGFWAALREIYPETRAQRCWVHKTANVLNRLPNMCRARPNGTCGRSGMPVAASERNRRSMLSCACTV